MSDMAIRVEGLIKNYKEVKALQGIDFEVPVGTIFGLLGPNGAGKTTAVRILSTILHPDGGRAEVMGHDVMHQADEVRHCIGLAGQYAAVDAHLTGRENLQIIGRLAQLTRREARQRADELLERFGLTGAADRPLKTYSGGMTRRLDVAAALMQRPPVIFLDEPTTGLDIQSRSELWEIIRELVAEGATVLLTTQYLEEADQLADRIAVVAGGRVVANDTAASLKARLGSTTIEIGLGSEDDGARAQALLSRLFSDHAEREGAVVRLTSGQGPLVLIEVLKALGAEGLTPESLSVREPTLDEVFLVLTGSTCTIDELEEGVPC
jgi:ABC-2 type transport system ATP-binding protein